MTCIFKISWSTACKASGGSLSTAAAAVQLSRSSQETSRGSTKRADKVRPLPSGLLPPSVRLAVTTYNTSADTGLLAGPASHGTFSKLSMIKTAAWGLALLTLYCRLALQSIMTDMDYRYRININTDYIY